MGRKSRHRDFSMQSSLEEGKASVGERDVRLRGSQNYRDVYSPLGSPEKRRSNAARKIDFRKRKTG